MTSSILIQQPNTVPHGRVIGDFDYSQDIVVDPLLEAFYVNTLFPRFTTPKPSLLPSGTNDPWAHLNEPVDNHNEGSFHSSNYEDPASHLPPAEFDGQSHQHQHLNDQGLHDHSVHPDTRHSPSSSSISAVSSSTGSRSPQPFDSPSADLSVGSPELLQRKPQEQIKPTQPQEDHDAPKRISRNNRKRSGISKALEGPRRNKFLERNRVAASKCRQKKKKWTHDLEDTKLSLESHNVELQSEYGEIVEQVTKMKNMLLSHSVCNDPIIDGWIEGEARKYVEKSIRQRQQGMGYCDKPGLILVKVGAEKGKASSSQDTIGPDTVTDGYLTPPLADRATA